MCFKWKFPEGNFWCLFCKTWLNCSKPSLNQSIIGFHHWKSISYYTNAFSPFCFFLHFYVWVQSIKKLIIEVTGGHRGLGVFTSAWWPGVPWFESRHRHQIFSSLIFISFLDLELRSPISMGWYSWDFEGDLAALINGGSRRKSGSLINVSF